MITLPEILQEYTITRQSSSPFPVKWEEQMGFFIVPKLGEKLSWAMYDFPQRNRSEEYFSEVTGRASVHNIEGVEIVVEERRSGEHESIPDSRFLTRTFITQLTDSHCRVLAESHFEGDIKRFYTFLDNDEFINNWGFGENNCGNEINILPKGIITREGDIVTTANQPFLLDVVGRYTVDINGKSYDCICVMDVDYYNTGIVSEQYLDKNGRTILWRRFNRNDWHLEYYHEPWTEKLPNNQRIIVNGETYVHWYDCITSYIC